MNHHSQAMNGYFEYAVRHAFNLATIDNQYQGMTVYSSSLDDFWDNFQEDLSLWAMQNNAWSMSESYQEAMFNRYAKSVIDLAEYFKQVVFYALPNLADADYDFFIEYYNPTNHAMVVTLLSYNK